jgi:hypothetical protein
MTEPNTQLETEFVFLDTEVFVREKFDWHSRSLSRLKELVASKHLRILTTSITQQEIKRKIFENHGNASTALKKYEILLGQLDARKCLERLTDARATGRLEALFDDFMRDLGVVEVPLVADLHAVFDAYFNQRPPFSERKKSEFPDAVVIHALRNWCDQRFARAYIVSGDPDLKACCDDALIHAETLNEIISKATVTKRIYNHLLEFVRENSFLRNDILRMLNGKRVSVSNRDGPLYIDVNVAGEIYGAPNLEIFELNVLRRSGDQFTCEIEFEAILDVEFVLAFEPGASAYRAGYEPGKAYFESESKEFTFTAEVLVAYDYLNTGFMEILSLNFNPEIEIELRELDIYRSLR